MKELEDFIEKPREYEEQFKRIDKWLSKIGDTDDAVRVASLLLSHAMRRDLDQAGYKYSQGDTHKAFRNEFGTYELDCVDHPGDILIEVNDKKIITFEPYSLGLEQLKDLITFCEEKDLEPILSGRSPYFPGKTLMVELLNRQEGKLK